MGRLASLILHLPPESAVGRLNATDADRWTVDHELLATLIETLDAVTLRLLRAWTKKGANLPKPLTITRPGRRSEPRPKPTTMDDPAARRFFGAAARYVPRKDGRAK